MAHTLQSEAVDFVDRAPLKVQAEVVVAAIPAAVWPALADASAWIDWFSGMREARYTSPQPHGVGSTRQVRVAILKLNEEILAFDVGTCFAFRVIDANVAMLRTMVEVVTLEQVEAGTKVVYRQGVEMESWARFLGPLVRGQLRSSLRKTLPQLARWVVARGLPGGAPN